MKNVLPTTPASPTPGPDASALEVDQWWETLVRLRASEQTPEAPVEVPFRVAGHTTAETTASPGPAEASPAAVVAPTPPDPPASAAPGSAFLRTMLASVGEPTPARAAPAPELLGGGPAAGPALRSATQSAAAAPEPITAEPEPSTSFAPEPATVDIPSELRPVVRPETTKAEPERDPEPIADVNEPPADAQADVAVDGAASAFEAAVEQPCATQDRQPGLIAVEVDLRDGHDPARRLRSGDAKSPELSAHPNRSLRELLNPGQSGTDRDRDMWMGTSARPLQELVRAGMPSRRPAPENAVVLPGRRAKRGRTVLALAVTAALCVAGGPVIARVLTSPPVASRATAPAPRCVNQTTGQVRWALPDGREVVTVIRRRQREQDLIQWRVAGSVQPLTVSAAALSTLKEC